MLATLRACSRKPSIRKDRRLRKSLHVLDHIICVSEAVAASVEELAPEVPVSVIPPLVAERVEERDSLAVVIGEVEGIYTRFANDSG